MSPTSHEVLRASRTSIEKHWGLLLDQLHKILPKVCEKYWLEPTALQGITGDLLCKRYIGEKAIRERGADVPVVPLLAIHHEPVKYWLSLHQSWSEPADPRSKKFVYHTTGVTVFFGKEGVREKVQLFRAEWPGLRPRVGGDIEFEAPGAGHPHWQFDAYQNQLRDVKAERQLLENLELLLSDQLPEVENFADVVTEGSSSEEESERLAQMQRITRMHFASSARWAEQPWYGDETNTQSHAKSPETAKEILNWITSTLVYVQYELSR